MNETAQKILVRRFLDRHHSRIDERLVKYKHIGSYFSKESFWKCQESKPYYCHYLAWRLGIWENEQLFENLDNLLASCQKMQGWHKKNIPGECEFNKYWGFIWELQCAHFFSDTLSVKVEWLKEGADFAVSDGPNQIYIECYTYQKSFALEEFINEIFNQIHPDIQITHIPFSHFSLAQNKHIDSFLDELFTPYIDHNFIQQKLLEVNNQSPILLPMPNGIDNFFVYLENINAPEQNMDLANKLACVYNTEEYINNAVTEATLAKKGSNNLRATHPNLIMVNILLSTDWQLAKFLGVKENPDIPEELDGISFSACGIDTKLTMDELNLTFRNENHPLIQFFNNHLASL